MTKEQIKLSRKINYALIKCATLESTVEYLLISIKADISTKAPIKLLKIILEEVAQSRREAQDAMHRLGLGYYDIVATESAEIGEYPSLKLYEAQNETK